MLGVFSATTPGFVIRKSRTVAGFALFGMALTGSILFAAEASHVALNPVFQFKVALIVLGLLNVERKGAPLAGCETMGAPERMPTVPAWWPRSPPDVMSWPETTLT